MIGKTLGHYRVGEQLGRGGMGEVYLADDLNLNRKVALKFLPDAFTGDPERMARFEREAKLLASLNHPNIAAIYGLEQAEGKRFLVLELVEGQTLAQRINKGPLPVEEALGVCRQIAEGLEAAHEKGVIHRDLKPANVMITEGDKVKILDFGLAKALSDETQSIDASQSPTITEAMTRPGVILGTAAYMSPEQAKGKSVDKRADIWAFGCILYECLTGKRVFEGETVPETLAAVLKGDQDWKLMPKDTPPGVREALQRCLQKDVKRRYHDIADVRLDIETPLPQSSETAVAHRPFLRLWLTVFGAVTILAGILIGAAVMKYFQHASARTAPVKSVIKVEPGHWLEGARVTPPWGLDQPTRTSMAISSDGRIIIYSAIRENPQSPQDKPKLYMRRTDQLEVQPISGTEGATSPFLSPDDRWVGFWAGGKLKKVSVDGGVPVTLCDAQIWFGASWGPDNNIVFASSYDSGLSMVPANGGKPEVLTIPEKTKEEFSHRLPHWLPDGGGLLFTIMRGQFDLEPRVAFLNLKTRKWSVLLENAADARYVPSGHVVFLRQGILMAMAFDINKRQGIGQPVPAVDGVAQAINAVSGTAFETAAGQYSVSDSGWLVYVPGGILPDIDSTLVWVDRKGNVQPVSSRPPAFFGSPRLSSDGRRIAYVTFGMKNRASVYDLNRGTETPVTTEGQTWNIGWTPDDNLVFDWGKFIGPDSRLYRQPADGSAPMERLPTGDGQQSRGASYSPDGATMAFTEGPHDHGHRIVLLDLRTGHRTPFGNSKANEASPAFSRDGRWIAYNSSESGRAEIWVRPFPGPGGRLQISSEGGREPLWARNGKQLFYRWARLEGTTRFEQVWEVDIRADGSLNPGKPRMLFEIPYAFQGNIPSCWDISPDDQRFLMVRLVERKPQPLTEMILVQNWFEELKRLIPSEKK
jgi:eukaryotic-like serine/threonine-protein kinase